MTRSVCSYELGIRNVGGTTGKLEIQSLVPVVIKQEREFFIFQGVFTLM